MRWIHRVGQWSVVSVAVTALGGGCLSRAPSTQAPETKEQIGLAVKNVAVDKIDLLLMIDNSASMGDKQEILSAAVPDLITNLVEPNCVGADGKPNGLKADPSKPEGEECAQGKPAFKPVVNIHVGIVSSSMGGFGSDSCPAAFTNPTNGALNAHNNDKGHLLNRAGTAETPIANANPSNFLAWFPGVARNAGKTPSAGATPYTDLAAFNRDFAGMVKGVNQFGCGYEAQLESWYHFLVQPDPYDAVVRNDKGVAAYAGLDQTILQQRADFLRPDSLVAVVLLTDEDDSSVDPLARGGFGWQYAETKLRMPQATPACATDPASPECRRCDPGTNCPEERHTDATDHPFVRFHKMKQRFGVDPQYPIARYVNGLKKLNVPDRTSEHDANGNYIGTAKCRNPLFAKNLPTSAADENDPSLCALEPGPRDPSLVFFAVIGGVPQDLLHFNPNDARASEITSSDWEKILGRDPDKYDATGMDPRMDQSVSPRPGRPGPSAIPGDNFVGDELRDWDTKGKDLQYACTFPLNTPVNCTSPEACDCIGGATPPLCGAVATQQARAKAYPTPREFRVVRALDKQGIVSSLCPITYKPEDKDSPLFGYRPAVKSIVDRLGERLANQCLPTQLTRDDTGKVACIILETLEKPTDTCEQFGLVKPSPELLARTLERRAEQKKRTDLPVCQVANQLTTRPGESCKESKDAGWCYVENTAESRVVGQCSQAIVFTEKGNPPPGVETDLLCIQLETEAPAK